MLRNGGIARLRSQFLKRAMKRYGQPKVIVTDRLRSYRAAMNVIGNGADQECRTLAEQPGGKFTPAVQETGRGDVEIQGREDPAEIRSVHASIHNHFNLDRHLNSRSVFKQNRSAALAEWRQLAA